MAFFQEIAVSAAQGNQKSPATLVIDASGSVLSNFTLGKAIFDQMETIIQNLPHENFRIVFWNSDGPLNKEFNGGVMVIPFVVTKTSLKQPFQMVKAKIKNHCLTFPHLGFDAIPQTWWNKTDPNHVYFVTDGQIGWGTCPPSEMNNLKQKFASSIKKMIANANNVHLSILTVESKNRDFNSLEALRGAAGCDVFEVIQKEGLTDLITKFSSFTPNCLDGYNHIATTRAPPGFVPFENKIFHEAKTGEFITWIYTQIQEKLNSEDDLIRMIQNLTATVRVLTKDKSKQISVQIIQNFAELFRGSVIEPMMVNFMLTDAIDLANQGKSEVFAKYRANLKDFYKMANDLLNRSVKNAVGIRGSFVSLPIHDKIITGPDQMVDVTMDFGGNRLPCCAVKVDHLNVPVLPLETTSSNVTEQCLRQYIRMIIGSQYGVDKLGDVVIYVVLGLTMLVVNSSATPEIKNAYRHFSEVMLKKKRLNTNITELERLESGEFPTPNSGRIEHFNEFMTTVNGILGTTAQPMVLWYAVIQSLNNPRLILKQLPHCQDAVLASFGEIPVNIGALLLADVAKPEVATISENAILDYKCLITLDDCSAVGGHKLLPHSSPTDQVCCPIHVFSESGYQQFVASHDLFCPVCYTVLTPDSFEPVQARSTDGGRIFSEELSSVYTVAATTAPRGRGGYASTPSHTPVPVSPLTRAPTQVASSSQAPSTQKKILFKMRGDVGTGKSTYAYELQQKLESLGLSMTVINESTDKYCKMGVQIKDAAGRVKAQMRKLNQVVTEYLVVIIDTCDDKGSGNIVFDYNFSDWTIHTVMPNFDQDNIRGYLEWSLRNVLNRPLHSSTTMFYLNPVSASVDVCLKVHSDKGRNLFGNRFVKVYSHITKDQILEEIREGADNYQAYLDREHARDIKIAELVNKVVDPEAELTNPPTQPVALTRTMTLQPVGLTRTMTSR